MPTSTGKEIELVEIGRWAEGTETAPVYARVVPALGGEPGRVEVWSFDTRVFSLTVEDDALAVLQHEPAPGGAPMSVRPAAPNAVELAVDVAQLQALARLPDAP